MTPAFDKKLLKKQISQILNQKEGVLFAYLFGSRARNTQSNQSDVDVAVYLSNEILKENNFYPEHLARDIEKTINISVDVRCLNHQGLIFLHQVLNQNQELRNLRDSSRS